MHLIIVLAAKMSPDRWVPILFLLTMTIPPGKVVLLIANAGLILPLYQSIGFFYVSSHCSKEVFVGCQKHYAALNASNSMSAIEHPIGELGPMLWHCHDAIHSCRCIQGEKCIDVATNKQIRVKVEHLLEIKLQHMQFQKLWVAKVSRT